MKEKQAAIVEPLERETIASQLNDLPIRVHVFDWVDSTNNEAKRYAHAGGNAPAAFLAEEQTGGRGRMGRSFYSPSGTGLYLSLLVRSSGELTDAVFLTTAAAVAVWRAVKECTGIEMEIKWVNDLYERGRKVCGILAESFLCDGERLVILGVGINLYTSEFPEELRHVAGGLLSRETGVRNRLAAAVISRLYSVVDNPAQEGLMELYRAHSLVLGKQVTYTENGVTHEGLAEWVDNWGRLQILRVDGSRVLLSGGEITLRLNDRTDERKGES